MKIRHIGLMGTMLLAAFLAALSVEGQKNDQAELALKAAIKTEVVDGDLRSAIEQYKRIAALPGAGRATVASALLRMGQCYEKLGESDAEEARKAYERIVREYADQTEVVTVAREKLNSILQAASLAKKKEAGPTLRQIPTPDDWEGPGVVSRDGKYLADIDGNTGDLCLGEIDTGKKRRLTNEGNEYSQYAYAPIWAPDSTRLAFIWVDEDGHEELRVMALDGSEPRTLVGADNAYWIKPLDWSPDAEWILVSISYRQQRTRDLSLVSLADGSVRSLKTFQDLNLAPNDCRFSPEGRVVAYSRPSEKGTREREIFLLSVAEGRESPLILHPADDNFFEWLPDGRGILFTSDRAGTTDLWISRLEKGQPQGVPSLVKRSIGPVKSMGISKMGAFYYRTPRSLADIYTVNLDPRTGHIVGSAQSEPLPYEGHNRMPVWSPDGKYLAYVSARPGEKKWVLCLYSPDSGKVREFRFDKTYGYPVWNPDGRHLYLQAVVSEGQGIYRMDVESGEVTPLMAAGEEEYLHHLRVTADGKWIVYVKETKTASRILRRDARSGEEAEIDRPPYDNNALALSPDGGRLAMMLNTDESTWALEVMRFPDGTPKEILRLKELGWRYQIAWSPDGTFIYYCDRPASGEKGDHLWRIPAAGGDPQDLGAVMLCIDGLSVHPDGSRITFSSWPTNREPSKVWVMENFLPPEK